MLEGEWTKHVTGQLHAMVVPYVASRRQPAGMPDRIVWSAIWQGWVEFKNISTPLGVAQKRSMCRLNAIKPGSAFIWRRCADGRIAVQYCRVGSVEQLAIVPVASVLRFCAEFYTSQETAIQKNSH